MHDVGETVRSYLNGIVASGLSSCPDAGNIGSHGGTCSERHPTEKATMMDRVNDRRGRHGSDDEFDAEFEDAELVGISNKDSVQPGSTLSTGQAIGILLTAAALVGVGHGLSARPDDNDGHRFVDTPALHQVACATAWANGTEDPDEVYRGFVDAAEQGEPYDAGGLHLQSGGRGVLVLHSPELVTVVGLVTDDGLETSDRALRYVTNAANQRRAALGLSAMAEWEEDCSVGLTI